MDRQAFIEASKDWMRNKIRKGAMVYYKCEATLKNGGGCDRRASQNEKYWFLDNHFCSQHAQLELRKQQI
jgi:hypothetical protein